jgi:hypothetical protein
MRALGKVSAISGVVWCSVNNFSQMKAPLKGSTRQNFQ